MKHAGRFIPFLFSLWSLLLSSPGIYILAKFRGTPVLYAVTAIASAAGSGFLIGVWVSQIYSCSYRDQLTGVYNRRYLDRIIKRELSRSCRGNGCLSIAVIDLDYFKSINDKYGHESGDRILSEFARLLVKNTRKTDSIIRLGGDEFLVILPGINDLEAKKYAERIQAGIAESDVFRGLSFCVGIATATRCREFRMLFREADKALYKAKASRNSVVCTTVQ
jgi:diguanylate cyclase (GGDEF) domain